MRHFDRALADAADGPVATIARLEATKGDIWDDERLLVAAIARAQSSRDAAAQAFAALSYGGYLGRRGDKLEKALGHIAQAIDIMGAQGERLQQALMMASQGRCYFARAGKLEESLA